MVGGTQRRLFAQWVGWVPNGDDPFLLFNCCLFLSFYSFLSLPQHNNRTEGNQNKRRNKLLLGVLALWSSFTCHWTGLDMVEEEEERVSHQQTNISLVLFSLAHLFSEEEDNGSWGTMRILLERLIRINHDRFNELKNGILIKERCYLDLKTTRRDLREPIYLEFLR